MKLYTLVNDQYLNHKQCGIQSTHALAEMSVKYGHNSKPYKVYENWAKNHKTMIMLRGGNSKSLEYHFDRLHVFAITLYLPIAKFYEDDTLNGALTAVAIIVPPDCEKYVVDGALYEYAATQQLINVMAYFKLV